MSSVFHIGAVDKKSLEVYSSVEISPALLFSLKVLTSSGAELQYPIMFPSTKTFAPESLKSALASKAGTEPISKSSCLTFSAFTPTEIDADNARFFTRPQLDPSGVSLGHKRPQWVGCRSRASKLG